jgi:hypothetical protein
MTATTNSVEQSQVSEKPIQTERASETIAYGFTHTSQGLVLIASTAHGLRAVLFGINRDRLLSDLRIRFPLVRLQAGDASHQEFADRVVAVGDRVKATGRTETAPRGEVQLEVLSAAETAQLGSSNCRSNYATFSGNLMNCAATKRSLN